MLELCCSCLKHKGFASGLESQQDFLASCHFLEKPTGCSLACRSRETACPAIGCWSSSVWSGDTLAMWNSERGTWNKCLAVRHLPIKYTCARACEIETNGAKFIDFSSFELAPTESDSVWFRMYHFWPLRPSLSRCQARLIPRPQRCPLRSGRRLCCRSNRGGIGWSACYRFIMHHGWASNKHWAICSVLSLSLPIDSVRFS